MILLNSWVEKAKAVYLAIKNPGRLSSSIYVKYPPDHTFPGRRVLNIGCGYSQYKLPNVVNLDGEACSGADIVWDLSKTPLPFKDEEFDLILANHVLEHVPNWWGCFKELARVVKIGGIIEVWLPGDGNSSQLGYRDHINIINDCSFAGIRGFRRNQGNAWETAQNEKNKYVCDLFKLPVAAHLERHWWIEIMPDSIKQWMATHLRNIVYQVGYRFQRLPPQEGA